MLPLSQLLLLTLALIITFPPGTFSQLNNDQMSELENILDQKHPSRQTPENGKKNDENSAADKGEDDDIDGIGGGGSGGGGHKGGDKDQKRRIQPQSSWNIGISLPWIATARFNLSNVPKSSLVATGYSHDKDIFICRVLSACRRMKILGKLNYKDQTCTVPCTATMSTLPARKLVLLQTDQRWHHYEVLTNPHHLNLFWALVDLRQKKKPTANDHLMPPRPVLAAARQPSFGLPPSFVARAECNGVSFVGAVQETNNDGTEGFYYGLYNVVDLNSVRVLNVMNTVPPLSEQNSDDALDGLKPAKKQHHHHQSKPSEKE